MCPVKTTHIALLIALVCNIGFCLDKQVDIVLDQSAIIMSKIGEYDHISYPNAINTIGNKGDPSLPVIALTYIGPYTATRATVRLLAIEQQPMPGDFYIYPIQPPIPLSSTNTAFVLPNPAVYESNAAYPSHPIIDYSLKTMAGFKLCTILLCPFVYNPKSRTLEFASHINVLITYDDSGKIPFVSSWQAQTLIPLVKSIVQNPEEVLQWAPPVRSNHAGSPYLNGQEYHEVFITTDELAASIEPIVQWRTKQGIPCTTMTVQSITSTYPGWDTPEKIRNFIKDADTTWGALYFALCGDNDELPTRYVSNQAVSDSFIATDHYYIDLDGTWDLNGNHYYGELEDSIDGYSDVFVGRISVETPDEVSMFLSKLFLYEKTPASGYLKKCLLPACQLWDNYHADIVNDSIANTTPDGWQDSKLYQSLGNVNHQITIDSINAGFGFIHFGGHGNWNGIYFAQARDTFIHTLDMPVIQNGSEIGIWNSIACFPGAFDLDDTCINDDCCAENYVFKHSQAAVAAIMNTRVGLGYPDEMGPSEMLDLEFYRKAFRSNIFRIGETHALSKDVYIPAAADDPAYWFCILELTLFGDPVMSMWLDEPQQLIVSHPESIPTGANELTITVSDARAPVENALVCLMGAGDVYAYDYTDANGEVTFTINATQADTLWITTTGLDHLPDEGFATVYEVGIKDKSLRDHFAFSFSQPMPTIFSKRTLLRYSLDCDGIVNLSVYNAAGQNIGTIIAAEKRRSGIYSLVWDGTIQGKRLSAGIYYLRLSTPKNVQIRKIILLGD